MLCDHYLPWFTSQMDYSIILSVLIDYFNNAIKENELAASLCILRKLRNILEHNRAMTLEIIIKCQQRTNYLYKFSKEKLPSKIQLQIVRIKNTIDGVLGVKKSLPSRIITKIRVKIDHGSIIEQTIKYYKG